MCVHFINYLFFVRKTKIFVDFYGFFSLLISIYIWAWIIKISSMAEHQTWCNFRIVKNGEGERRGENGKGKKSIFHAIRCPSIAFPTPSFFFSQFQHIFPLQTRLQRKCRKKTANENGGEEKRHCYCFSLCAPWLSCWTRLFFFILKRHQSRAECLATLLHFFFLFLGWWNTRSLHFFLSYYLFPRKIRWCTFMLALFKS